ncbi:MAG: META domain-containing protein [Chloroflexota bacterium]|nr:META domain-containing protein [Chloroflexota bacterium]
MATQAYEELHQHSWQLAEMGLSGALRPIPPEFPISLQFEELRVHGASACNRYFATCHLDGSQLHFQSIGATRMMCSEPAMALESDFFAALEHVETYQLQTDRLTLYDDQGKSLLLFHKE